jgi:hypothetical protein
MKNSVKNIFVLFLITSSIFAQDAPALSKEQQLAAQVANPISSLISVPFQSNLYVGIGPLNGSRSITNFQPVVPMKLSENLNLITRMVLPIVSQQDLTGFNQSQTGLSDALVSAFFSPSKVVNGTVWGVGPAVLVPTATNDFLGTKKLGVGPTIVLLKQAKGWTYALLANQIWSVAGDKNRADVNQLYVQPILVYNWKSGAGINMVAEYTQNWETNTSNVVLTPTVNGITKLGSQLVQLAIGPLIPIVGPSKTRAEYGMRASINFLFPKKQ